MTWYWWTHWFWITSIAGVLLEILAMAASVETYPLSPPLNSKEFNKKDRLLKVPFSGQSDSDDVVFPDGVQSLSSIIRDSKILHSKEAGNISSDRNSENVVADPMASDSNKQKVPDLDSRSKTSMELNRTKEDVESIASNNSSFLSTVAPMDAIPSNTSQSENLDLEEEMGNSTSTPHSGPDQTELFDFEHPSSSNNFSSSISTSESAEEPPLGNHSSGAIDFVDETAPKYRRLHALENITKEEEVIRAQIERQLGERGRKSKVLAEYRHELKYINFSSDAKNLLARSAAVSLDFDEQDDGNVSSEALSIQRAYILDAGAISGICFAAVGLFCVTTLAGIVLYRRRYLNKPQTLSEPDSSAYIDDSTIRDNSDEMYSLDNDSFLNSLEAMTIQNYWTDTVKHTKL